MITFYCVQTMVQRVLREQNFGELNTPKKSNFCRKKAFTAEQTKYTSG